MTRSAILLGLFVAVQIVASAAGRILGNIEPLLQGISLSELPATPLSQGTALLVGEALLCTALIWAFRRESPTALLRTGERPATATVWKATAGFVMAGWGVSLFFDPLTLPDGGTTAQFAAMRRSLVGPLLLCAVGPLTEELVFRRGIIPALCAKGHSPRTAVILSAAAFALVHNNLAQALPAFLLGLLLGRLFLRSRNLRLCLPAHIFYNAIAFTLLFRPHPEPTPEWLPLWASLTAGFLLTAAGIAVVVHLCSKPSSAPGQPPQGEHPAPPAA